MRLPLLGLLVSSPAIALAAPPPEPTTLVYRVKPRDTLVSLAQRGLKRPQDYVAVQRLNRVRDPRRLVPGSTLRLPVGLLRTQPIAARVAAFRGAATVGGQGARIGLPLVEGQEIRTGANAFLSVELADGSLVTLPSRSRVVVAGLHRIVLTGQQVKSFRLLSGRAETDVQPVRPGDRFEIRTPLSVAAVRGTNFRVTFDEGSDAAGTSVVEGAVGVAAGMAEVAVPQGQGLIATEAGPSQPVALLPRPALADPDRLQDEEEVVFRVQSLPGAAAYRIQLASDAGFVDIFAEADGRGPELRFTGVPNGTHFARITALSAEGLEGLPAVTSVERRQNSITAEAGAPDICPAARCLRFKWRAGGEGERRFRFQLARAGEELPLVDLPELTGTEVVLTDLPGGDYRWRVESALIEKGARQAKWLEWQELRVAPAAGR